MTVYTVSESPFVTVMVRRLSPVSHDAFPPLVTSVALSPSPSMITTSASSSVGVAVTLLLAFDVVAVYASTDASNVGVSVNDPIVSLDRVDINFLLR